LDAERFRPFRVAQHVAALIVLRVLPISAGHVLARIEHMHALFIVRDFAIALHRSMDLAVQLTPRFIVGRDDERVFRRAHILAGYLADALAAVADLVYPALAVEIGDCFLYFAPRKLAHGFFERRVFLPDDFIEPGRAHPSLL